MNWILIVVGNFVSAIGLANVLVETSLLLILRVENTPEPFWARSVIVAQTKTI